MYIKREFKSFGEFVARAQQIEWAHGRASRRPDTSYSWDLNADFPKAVDLATNGWAEGAEDARRCLKLVEEKFPPVTHQQTFRYNNSGSYADVDRYLHGEPENMVEFVADPLETRPLTILVNGGMTAAVSAADARQRGAAIAALIDILEGRGYRCDVTLVQYCSGRHGEFEIRVKVKEAGQPLDLDRLVFAVAHPACHRRLGWGVKENESPAVCQAFGFNDGGYSSSGNIPYAEQKAVDLYLPIIDWSNSSNFHDATSAAEWLSEVLTQNNFITRDEIEGGA